MITFVAFPFAPTVSSRDSSVILEEVSAALEYSRKLAK